MPNAPEGDGLVRNNVRRSNRIALRNLPPDVTVESVESMVSSYGRVAKCEANTYVRNGLNPDTQPKTMHITFESAEDAEHAQTQLNGYDYGGSVLRAEFFSPRPPRRSPNMMMFQHNGPPNPNRIPEFPLRILVPSDMVGAIIGRKGETIKEITSKSHARVDVHRRESPGIPEKVIQIFGLPEACTNACREILTVLQRETVDGAKSEVPLKLLAHNNLCGRLIGKEGAVIKRIMEDCECRVNVSRYYNDQLDRVVTLRGSLDAVCQAEALVSAKLRQCYESDINVMGPGGPQPPYVNQMGPPPPHHMMPPMMNHIPMNVAAAAIQHANSFGNPPPTDMRAAPYGMLPPGATIGPQGIHHTGPPPHYISHPGPPPQHFNGGGPLPPMGGGPMPGGPGGRSPNHPITIPPPSAIHLETATLVVPNMSVGAIIGTKGSNIRNIIRASGAQITIAPLEIKSDADDATPPPETEATTDTETPEQNGDAPAVNGDADAPQSKQEATNVTDDGESDTPGPAVDEQRPTGVPSRQADRYVQIVGPPESQWKAQFYIYEKIKSEGFYGGDSNRPRAEIIVPRAVVGRIIGKNGQNVRELQRVTGSTIKLPDKSEDPTDEVKIQILGNFYASQWAQRRIRWLVDSAEQRGIIAANGLASTQMVEASVPIVNGHDDEAAVGEVEAETGEQQDAEQGATDELAAGIEQMTVAVAE